MDEQQQEQLTRHIQSQLQAGIPPSAIKDSLVRAGWGGDTVDFALQSLLATGTVPPGEQIQVPDNLPPQVQQPQSAIPEQYQTTGNPYLQQETPQAAAPAEPTFDAPQKYRVFIALGETTKAIGHNAPAFFGAGALAVAGAIMAFILFDFLYATLNNKIGRGGNLGTDIGSIITLVLGLYTLTAITMSVIQCVLALAIMDGAEGRKSSIGTLLKASFSKFPRVLLTNALVGIAETLPLLIVTGVGLVLIITRLKTGGSQGSLGIILVIAVIAASVWVIIAFLRYALAPMIAIFEPQTPLWHTLGRSRHLLQSGGQWFIVKGALILLAVIIALALATGQNLQQLQNSTNIILNIAVILIEVIAIGVLVMLYRNRRVVRNNQR